jgi:hypothetical protein
MADAYDPPSVEAAWYSWWEKSRFFAPEQNPFVIPFFMNTPKTRDPCLAGPFSQYLWHVNLHDTND